MPTQTKENYLKAIYFLEVNCDAVTVTELGKEMQVSKPTVNNMIKKLTAIGWINYQRYKPIELTETGRLQAALVIRKHRLTEMFLMQIMGFGWEEVHQIAEEMEHLKTEILFDRMDEILGYPTTDPHGSPIPDKDGKIHRRNYDLLSTIEVGKRVRVMAVADSSISLLHLLNEKEIKLGTSFTIVKKEKFDGTMVVNYDGHDGVTLSHEVCKRLKVESVLA